MKLSVFERLILSQILSEPGVEADFTTLRIVRKLRENVSFSEEELAALNFRQGMDWSKCPKCGASTIEFTKGRASPERRCVICGFEGMAGENQIFWNQAAPQEAEIEIGKKATEVVKDRLEAMDKSKKLVEERHFTLCDKFGLKFEDE